MRFLLDESAEMQAMSAPDEAPPSPPVHIPVMLAEILAGLAPQPGQTFLDGTLGGGGHTRALAAAVGPTGCVLAVDRDPAAVAAAERNLAGWPILLANRSYRELPEVMREANLAPAHGLLLDLGLSSDQLADPERGFSFSGDGPLDMRFDPTTGEPAARLLHRLDAEQLADLIYQYGEERYSRRIARSIVEARKRQPLRTVGELAALVRRSIPRSSQEKIDPATRTFQALRIAVNAELETLAAALNCLPEVLRPGGKVAILSFHSLEDRLVKNAFRDDPRWEPLTRKPLVAGPEELARNPRARSAKLRIAQRRAPEDRVLPR